MACCKCLEYKWDDPQVVVWRDTEGNNEEYCVFHAPEEHKGVGAEEFNDLVFARIDKAKGYSDQEMGCNLSGTVFPWNISFSQYDKSHPLPSIAFKEANFCGKANFRGATFRQPASFNLATFREVADFTGATFREVADFTGATFRETAYFGWATFRKAADFGLVTFRQTANFGWATFRQTADFQFAIFRQTANFHGTALHQTAIFVKTLFGGPATFESTTFVSTATFNNASFEGLTKFTRCTTSGPLVFQELQSSNDIRFFGMDMYFTNFLRTPLTNVRFQSVTWDKPTYDNHFYNILLHKPNIEDRYCLPIECDPKSAGIAENDPLLNDALRFPAVAEFYRQMKKRRRDEQNDAEASLWHYAEKEVQLKWHRLSKPLSFQRLVLEAYRYLSRYGEDPRQAAEVLFYLFVLLSGVLALGGFEQLGQPPYAITGKQVSGFFLSLTQYAFFIKPAWTPSAVFDALALFISRLVIPIQAAIFGIALRNKLHR